MGTRRHLASPRDTPRNTTTITMNSRVLVALLLCGLLAASDAIFVIGAATTGTVVVGSTAAAGIAALGLGALAVLKGALIGAALSRRGKREISSEEQESFEVAINVAQQIDSTGCVPKLLCYLETLPAEELTHAGSVLLNAFDGHQKTKLTSDVYDAAAAIGIQYARNNPAVCDKVFNKCILSNKQLSSMLDTAFLC